MKFKVGDTAIYIGQSVGRKNERLYGKKCEIENIIGKYRYSVFFLDIYFPLPAVRIENIISEEEFKEREERSLLHKDVDPYEEEIWESADDKFEKADAIYIGNSRGFYGKECEICHLYSDNKNVHIVFPGILNKIGQKSNLITTIDCVISEEEFVEREKRIKEQSLLHKDIDPYSEEIWEAYHKSQGKLNGKYIRFVYDIKKDVKKNIPYKIKFFDGVSYYIEGERGKFEVDPFYEENEDFFIVTQDELEKRRKLWIDKHPEDPYGEEIWENKNQISGPAPYDYKKGDKIICIDNKIVTNFNSMIIGTIPFTVGEIYFINSDRSVTGDDNRKYHYSLQQRFVPYDKNLYEEGKRRKEEKRLSMMGVDPYSEEIWEEWQYPQLPIDKFKKGDIVIYVGTARNIIGGSGDLFFTGDLYGSRCKINNIKETKFGSLYEVTIIGTDKSFVTLEERFMTEEEFEKIEKKKEEQSLLHKDVDPYSEEIWEMWRSNMPDDVIIKKITPTDIWINWKNIIDFLKRKLVGKCASFWTYERGEKGRAGHFFIDDIYMDVENLIHMVGHGFFSDSSHNFDLILYLSRDIEYEDKRIISKEDPYGEEDWENESVTENISRRDSYGFLKDYVITYNGKPQGLFIAHELFKIGFTIHAYPILENDIEDYRCFVRGNNYDFSLSFSKSNTEDISSYLEERKHINFEEFCDLININYTKFKKVERPDVDPYGEEDWGWENESINDIEYWKNMEFYRNLKKGDLVYLKGMIPYTTLSINGKTGTFIGHEPSSDGIGSTGYANVRIDGYTWAIHKEFNIIVDKNKIEKILKNREEQSLKHLDDDPYGEEIWEIKNYKNFINGR